MSRMRTGMSWRAMLVLVLALCQAAAWAADEAPGGAKPFAEERVVLQISDNDPFKQTLVLNVASNLIKHYGPDKVDVEIVAFGPGLRLMMDGNANADRIEGLAASGVRFAACSNTIAKMTSLLGEEPKLDAHAARVDAGVVRIIDLTNQGYTLVKP